MDKELYYICKSLKYNDMNQNNEIVIYQSQDGTIKVDVLFEGETVWLTIEQMSLLFGKSRSTINEHILNIYKEGELVEIESMRKIGNSDFSTKPTNYYNLDVIISVGYRVKFRRRRADFSSVGTT
ncbi:hypothetical protein [Bacteroides faecium]|nr:hypothetical protein [Bacteroides faecium]